MPEETGPPSPRESPRPQAPAPRRWSRWGGWVAIGALLVLLMTPGLFSRDNGDKLTYKQFMDKVEAGQVRSAEIDTESNKITGELTSGEKFTAEGPDEIGDADKAKLEEHGVDYSFKTPQPNFFFNSLLPLLL